MRAKLLFLSICFLFFPKIVQAEAIDNFKVDYTVNQNGTVSVNEQIDYNFGNLYRHGIFRKILFVRQNKNNQKFKITYSNFKINHRFTEEAENNFKKLIIGDPNKTITGKQQYTIDYLISGGLTYFSDHDEFYWNVTGNDWPGAIEKAEANVYLPFEANPNTVKMRCFTGVRGSRRSDCTTNLDKNIVRFSTTRPLNIGEELTIAVSWPKGLVAVLEPAPYTPFWETSFGKILKIILTVGAILLALGWYVVYPIWIIVKWIISGRDPKGMVGQTSAWFSPPKVANKELTPAEVGTLVDEKVDFKDIFGTIVDLARRGFIKIEEKEEKELGLIKTKNVYFHKTKEFANDKSLLNYEKKLLVDIFLSSSKVKIKNKQMYTTFSSVSKMLYDRVVELELFPQNPNSIRVFYSVISTIALITANIFLFIVALLFGFRIPKKTTLGVDSANIAMSLRKFLVSQDKQLEFQAEKQMMFEKLLPYAIVFGVEKIWAKRFSTFDLKNPDWYDSSSNFNSALMLSSLNRSFSSVKSSMTSTTSSSGFSSGFSGGSSGGGGGGGGGSW